MGDSAQGWSELSLAKKTGVVLLLFGLFSFIVSSAFDDLPSSSRPARGTDSTEQVRNAMANEARRKEEEQERLRQEQTRLAAIEAARPPAERAAMAISALSGGSDDLAAAVCRARELLGPLQAKDRGAPDVRKAIAMLQTKEVAALRATQVEFEKFRGLVCRDGSASDTCLCHGSHRGCCSHHGGVAGCEPLPTEINCAFDPVDAAPAAPPSPVSNSKAAPVPRAADAQTRSAPRPTSAPESVASAIQADQPMARSPAVLDEAPPPPKALAPEALPAAPSGGAPAPN